MSNELTREDAQKALDAAQAQQKAAIEALTKAKEAQRAATVSVTTAKSAVMEADGNVLLARAALNRLGGPISTGAKSSKGDTQSDLCAAVVKILQVPGLPMTVDEIFKCLQAEGVTMGGANPRDNLAAYIARWSKVPASGIVNRGRGLWASTAQAPAAEVPSFLAPVEEPVVLEAKYETVDAEEVPSFLAPVEEPLTPVNLHEVGEDTPGPEGLSLLPEGFPGRDALTQAGLVNVEDLAGKTHDQLRRIKGIGAETARLILAALNPEA